MNNTDNNKYNIDLTSFLEELGLKDLSPDKKAEYSEQLLKLLESRIQIILEESLSDEDLAFMESKSESEIAEYLDSKGLNLAEISTQAGQEIREEFLTSMSFAQGYIDKLAGE